MCMEKLNLINHNIKIMASKKEENKNLGLVIDPKLDNKYQNALQSILEKSGLSTVKKNEILRRYCSCLDTVTAKIKTLNEILKELGIDLLEFEGIADERKKSNEKIIKIDNFISNALVFYNRQPFFFDKTGLFWFWIGNKYEHVDETEVMNKLDDTLGFMGQTVNSRIKNNYLEAFKRVGRKKIPKEAPVKWIQFKEKAYSIKSNKIYQVEPNYFFTNPIPWEIGESEDTPMMDKLFKEWVGEKNIKTLYELIAYCCYREYPIQLLFCLVGSGRNGKGCFLKVLDKFLGGDINVTSTSLDLISGNNKSRFESFRLFKKLVAIMGETNFGLLTNTSLLKQLTGGDKIGFEKKGKDPFTGYNYAKIIIASNSLPTTQDTSDGFFRRWLIIDFQNEFPEGKDITTTIPDIEYNNLAKKIIRIIPELLERGSFTNQGTIQERRTKYMISSNPLPLFIQKCCVIEEDRYISYNEFYTSYIRLLKKLKKRRISRKEFKTDLEDEGLWVERLNKDVDGDGTYKTGYFVEGIDINYDIYDNYTKNPTQFLYILELSGKSCINVIKVIKNKPLDYEELITPYISHCKACGASPCHFYYKGFYLCSMECLKAYKALK